LKSGSLNLLEPSGPVQVCNGIALPYHVNKYRRFGDAYTFLVKQSNWACLMKEVPSKVRKRPSVSTIKQLRKFENLQITFCKRPVSQSKGCLGFEIVSSSNMNMNDTS